VATAREAKMLAHGLADDLSTGIEVQRYCRPFRRCEYRICEDRIGTNRTTAVGGANR